MGDLVNAWCPNIQYHPISSNIIQYTLYTVGRTALQDGRSSQIKRWSSVLSEDDIGRSADSGYELGSSIDSSLLPHDR